MKFLRNKVTTILGPNGSGKSTLLKLISGVLSPTTGNIIINGINLWQSPKKALLHIQNYIDDVKIFNFLSVSEYFNLVIYKNCNKNYKILHARLLEFIKLCQINKYLKTQLQQCSYSIIRIIKIICTFLTDRPIVLLDDPMEGLDYILMQNICALFATQKSYKTIIFSSCDSNVIEYLTDSVVVLIHGKNVSQTFIENFNIEQMVYRLIFWMERGNSDYTVTRFIKNNFPMIKHEETIGKMVYFSIPKLQIERLWKLLDLLEVSCEKLGIWKYKINPISMRHFLSYSYDNYMKKKTHNIVRYSNDDVEPEDIKETSLIYKKQFILLLGQRIIYYSRYPNRLIMRFLIPILVMLIWTTSTSLSHPTIFTIDHGFFEPSYREEINLLHQVYIGCEGTGTSCDRIFRMIKPHLYFIHNINLMVFSKYEFEKFQIFLFEKGQKDFLQYNNETLFCVYFITDNNHQIEAIVMANDYKNRIFATSVADNIMMFPKMISISRFSRNDFHVKTLKIDINFLFRLIIILLTAYSMTTHRYTTQTNHRQFYLIHKLAGIHYSILHLPYYIVDLFLQLLIICFMILILHLMQDHHMTSIRGSVMEIISLFFLFAMADSAFKSLIQHIFGFSPIIIFGMNCIDIFLILYLNLVYLVSYVIKIRKYSFGGIRLNKQEFLYLDFFCKLLFPSANLNAGIKSIQLQDSSNVNGILFLQWIFYFMMIFIYNSQEFKIRDYTQKIPFINKKFIGSKIKNLNDPKSFLFIKNISFVRNHKLYFSNVSNEFKQGSIWGILGGNNSGKTNLLNIILGIIKPTSGGVYLHGQLINSFSVKKKGIKIGFCSEKLFYIPDLSVEETLMYWSRLKLLPEYFLKNAVYEILNVLLLLNEMNYCVKFLSKTSIKKLDIAIAILGYPEIIILDDPLSSLDSISRIGVMKLIQKAKEHNSTIIISAQEMSDLRNIITNILILSDEKVYYQGGLINAIRASKLGYYLTIFRSLEELYEMKCDDLTELISVSFTDATLFKSYASHIVYFLPFQDINDPNTTKILIFMETIKDLYNYKRYIIRYDVYHSPNI